MLLQRARGPGAGATSRRLRSCRGSPRPRRSRSRTRTSASAPGAARARAARSARASSRRRASRAPGPRRRTPPSRAAPGRPPRLAATAEPEMIDGEVVRDPEQPGGERSRLPAEPADRLEHPHEGLRRQVLGVVPVADAHVQIAVDAIEVERGRAPRARAVALLGARRRARTFALGSSRPRSPSSVPPPSPRESARTGESLTQLPLNPTRPSREKRLT